VSGSNDRMIWVWDAETGVVALGPLSGHSNSVNSVSFSPDGKRIVSGSWDSTIRVWDTETGELVAGPFNGHNDWVTSVAFSPDSKWIVSGSEDRTIRVWNAMMEDSKVSPSRKPRMRSHL
jgi:WD40 repeat protein